MSGIFGDNLSGVTKVPPLVLNLNEISFSFNGRIIPGESLASLLITHQQEQASNMQACKSRPLPPASAPGST